MAFELVKGMQAEGLDWGDGYRSLGRQALASVLRDQMGRALDEHLEEMARGMWPTGATALIRGIC